MNDLLTVGVGFVVGIATKVKADAIAAETLGPKLATEFAPKQPFIQPSDLVSNGQVVGHSIYARLKVVNRGRRTAKNCRGFITRIEREAEPHHYVLVDGGDECLQLIWSNSLGGLRMSGMDLAPGMTRYLDILSLVAGRPWWEPHGLRIDLWT